MSYDAEDAILWGLQHKRQEALPEWVTNPVPRCAPAIGYHECEGDCERRLRDEAVAETGGL